MVEANAEGKQQKSAKNGKIHGGKHLGGIECVNLDVKGIDMDICNCGKLNKKRGSREGGMRANFISLSFD